MGYLPLNNATTLDTYDNRRTLLCPGAGRINIDVTNAAILYQLGHGGGEPNYDPEVFMGPGFRSLDPVGDAKVVADAIRVRSAVAGVPAQVTVQPR